MTHALRNSEGGRPALSSTHVMIYRHHHFIRCLMDPPGNYVTIAYNKEKTSKKFIRFKRFCCHVSHHKLLYRCKVLSKY